MSAFLREWRAYGLRVALYNLGFRIVHRHDAHVRVWGEGETCSGCERCP